jgi:hypothetical protein
VHAYSRQRQFGYGCAHIHCVTSKPVKFRDHQHVPFLKPIPQLREAGSLLRRDGTRNALGHYTARLDIEPRRLYLVNLIVSGLFCG